MVDDCTSVGVRSNNNHHHHCDTEPHHHHQDSDQHHHSKQLVSICFGCGQEIFDRYILRVAPDLEWHAACLKCAECQQFLDESCKAFVRNGKTYCKLDYLRLFGEQCARCREYFGRNELVMKAPHRTYHVHCFTCIYCRQQLKPGDQFVLQDDELYCKNDCDLQHQYQHHRYLQPPPPFMRDFAPPPSASSLIDSDEWVVESALTSLDHPPMIGTNTTPPPSSMRSPHSDISSTTAAVPMIGSNSSSSSTGSSAKKPKKDKPKTTRIRTVLNEKQLMTLRACYNANARPDALMKEQLVEMTGLSARVIRVWFQNKRCKDKKRQIAMKQQQQSIEKDRALNGVRMHGVGPLIAHSPSAHHESSSLLAGALVDVQHYPQNHPALWTTTTSTIASSPSQHHHHQHMDAIGAAPFQQLMHSFGDMPTGGSGVTVSSGDIGSFMIPTGSTSYAPVSIPSGVDDMDRFSPPMNAGASDLSSPSNSDYFAIIFDC